MGEVIAKSDNTRAHPRHELPPVMGKAYVGPFGCNAKEAEFAELVAEGEHTTNAYQKAWNQPDRNLAYKGASRVARLERVQGYVSFLRKKMDDEVLHDADHARKFILQKLYDEASDAERSADRLRAVELLGKVDFVGIFREQVIVDEPKRDMDELKSEIKQRLTRLLKAPD